MIKTKDRRCSVRARRAVTTAALGIAIYLCCFPSASVRLHAASGLRPITEPPKAALIKRTAVFGVDDRMPLPSNLRELERSIGIVSSETERTVCTGFCVGRRTVATAAHCVFRTAGERRPDLASFQFRVGPRNDQRSSALIGRQTGAHRQHVIAGSIALSVAPPINATRDWALMRLEHPVCNRHSLLVENIDPKRISGVAARRRLLHVSFHGDLKNWRLSLSQSCATRSLGDDSAQAQIGRDFSDISALVLHECDSGLASSGSPLLALSADNSLRVVAINVGTYQQTRYLVTDGSVTRRFKPATVANTAVAGSAFADYVLAFGRADILGSRQAIRRLQIALKAHGFDAGPPDGIYGDRTRNALVAFEITTGRPGIGLATQQVLSELEQPEAR